jgi:hypothetical protein
MASVSIGNVSLDVFGLINTITGQTPTQTTRIMIRSQRTHRRWHDSHDRASHRLVHHWVHHGRPFPRMRHGRREFYTTLRTYCRCWRSDMRIDRYLSRYRSADRFDARDN